MTKTLVDELKEKQENKNSKSKKLDNFAPMALVALTIAAITGSIMLGTGRYETASEIYQGYRSGADVNGKVSYVFDPVKLQDRENPGARYVLAGNDSLKKILKVAHRYNFVIEKVPFMQDRLLCPQEDTLMEAGGSN
ncbi:MAG: hypothetical protein AABY15_01310 [Nanoarchaeota archaeon]